MPDKMEHRNEGNALPPSAREVARQQAGQRECAEQEENSPSHCESSDSPLTEGAKGATDFFQRDADINKALKTIRKAVFMRLVVMALLIWVLLKSGMELWVMGLMVFVMIINLTGLLPLIQEWRKQKQKLDEIWAEE